MAEFIGRYLKKSELRDITYADLLSFLKEKIEENLTLEYKPRGLLVQADGSAIKTKDDRDIRGFANSAGGLLILGVKEKPESYKGKVVKIRPGPLSEIPPTVTRETIEHNLNAKIQFRIEGITILPLRKSTRSKNCVYLIDVPQSPRAPHRVNEIIYYHRYNFSTVEMQHYQIVDLFGKRLAPDLDIELEKVQSNVSHTSGANTRTTRISVVLKNRGHAAAKYVTCLCSVLNGADMIIPPRDWSSHDDKKICQYETKTDRVIYPDIRLNAGQLSINKQWTGTDEPENPIFLIVSNLRRGNDREADSFIDQARN